MYFTLLGPTAENSAHCRYLSAGNAGLLLDAGLDPLREGRAALPDTSALDHHPEYYPVHAILLSHAHVDHMAALPVLAARWPEAAILCTEATWRLTRLQLCRHATLWAQASESGAELEEPLYGPADVQDLEERVRFVEKGERLRLEIEGAEELHLTAFDAGHILGSTSWLIEAEGQSLFYTADLCGRPQSVIQGAVYPPGADVVVSECTVAWSPAHAQLARRAEIERLADSIREVAALGGSILMPVFNMGRAQELLYILHSLKRKGRIPPLPVYLGRRAWEIAQLYDQFAAKDRRLLPDFQFSQTLVDILDPEESALDLEGSRIFLVPSGMLQPHSASWRVARRMLPLPLQAIFFVGHSAGGSFAKRLLKSKPGDLLEMDGAQVPLHCRVESFLFSSHSSLPELLDMLQRVKPRLLVALPGRKDSARRFLEAAQAQQPELRVEEALPGSELDVSDS
ncbi:MAG: MBL fold metallo-hydrolase [Candidatus Delongbacteria bacterium]